jgi:hypothetical protein
MTIEQFTAALRAEPFRPFVLHAVSGKEYRVNHPEMALRTPSGRTVVVVTGDETFELLDLNLMKSISFPEAPASAPVGESNLDYLL